MFSTFVSSLSFLHISFFLASLFYSFLSPQFLSSPSHFSVSTVFLGGQGRFPGSLPHVHIHASTIIIITTSEFFTSSDNAKCKFPWSCLYLVHHILAFLEPVILHSWFVVMDKLNCLVDARVGLFAAGADIGYTRPKVVDLMGPPNQWASEAGPFTWGIHWRGAGSKVPL